MKKLSYLFLVLFLFNSCAKEDINAEPPFPIESFIGSWAYDTVTVDGETRFYPHRSECYKDHFIFRHNEGQWNMYTETIYLDSNCANQTANLEWQLTGDILRLYFGEQLVATIRSYL